MKEAANDRRARSDLEIISVCIRGGTRIVRGWLSIRRIMTFQRRGTWLRSPALQDHGATRVPTAVEDCSGFAIHDIAALAEGNLSPGGMRRLARHIPGCATCGATLAVIIDDMQPGRGADNQGLAAWLAMASGAEDAHECPDPDHAGDKEPRALKAVAKRS